MDCKQQFEEYQLVMLWNLQHRKRIGPLFVDIITHTVHVTVCVSHKRFHVSAYSKPVFKLNLLPMQIKASGSFNCFHLQMYSKYSFSVFGHQRRREIPAATGFESMQLTVLAPLWPHLCFVIGCSELNHVEVGKTVPIPM